MTPRRARGPPGARRRARRVARRAPGGHGHAGRAAGPERRAAASSLDRDGHDRSGRHPDSDIFLDDITVSRRHAEIAPRRRRLRGARRRLAERHLRQPRAGRRRRRCTTSTSSRSGGSCCVFLRRRRASGEREHERTATATHLSIGEVLAQLRDEFPDITISKIRFLESQGLIDPERTPSGYRKFYDGRRRAAALDPPPAEGALPAAEGDQGAPRRAAARRASAPCSTRAGTDRRRAVDAEAGAEPAPPERSRRRRRPRARQPRRRPPRRQAAQRERRRRAGAVDAPTCRDRRRRDRDDRGSSPTAADDGYDARRARARPPGSTTRQLDELESSGCSSRPRRRRRSRAVRRRRARGRARSRPASSQHGIEARHLRMYRTSPSARRCCSSRCCCRTCASATPRRGPGCSEDARRAAPARAPRCGRRCCATRCATSLGE